MQPLGSTDLDLREIITVSYLMYVLKEHYSLVDGDSNIEIRQYILLIVKQFMTRVSVYAIDGLIVWHDIDFIQGKGIDRDELVAILNYLASVPEVRRICQLVVCHDHSLLTLIDVHVVMCITKGYSIHSYVRIYV